VEVAQTVVTVVQVLLFLLCPPEQAFPSLAVLHKPSATVGTKDRLHCDGNFDNFRDCDDWVRQWHILRN
jgi:hypothetical protein